VLEAFCTVFQAIPKGPASMGIIEKSLPVCADKF
jgi:hypothetical protein